MRLSLEDKIALIGDGGGQDIGVHLSSLSFSYSMLHSRAPEIWQNVISNQFTLSWDDDPGGPPARHRSPCKAWRFPQQGEQVREIYSPRRVLCQGAWPWLRWRVHGTRNWDWSGSSPEHQRKQGAPHPTAPGTGVCQKLQGAQRQILPWRLQRSAQPSDHPDFHLAETQQGTPRAYMTSDPQDHEIIKKCVLTGATKMVVTCYTSEKIFKNWIGGPQKRTRICFLCVCEVILPTLERKGNHDLFNWKWLSLLWQTLEVFSLLLRLHWWLSG